MANVCKNCEAPLVEGANFCIACGQAQSQPPPTAQAPPQFAQAYPPQYQYPQAYYPPPAPMQARKPFYKRWWFWVGSFFFPPVLLLLIFDLVNRDKHL